MDYLKLWNNKNEFILENYFFVINVKEIVKKEYVINAK